MFRVWGCVIEALCMFDNSCAHQHNRVFGRIGKSVRKSIFGELPNSRNPESDNPENSRTCQESLGNEISRNSEA